MTQRAASAGVHEEVREELQGNYGVRVHPTSGVVDRAHKPVGGAPDTRRRRRCQDHRRGGSSAADERAYQARSLFEATHAVIAAAPSPPPDGPMVTRPCRPSAVRAGTT